MGQGPVHETPLRLAERLREERIDGALVGGMSLVAHGYRRFTEDIELLLTEQGLEAFHQRLVGRGYVPAFPGARKTFEDAETGVRIEVIVSGEFPCDGKPKPVAFPDPKDIRFEREGLWFVRLEPLLELKLASGLSAPGRLKDLADVQDLIRSLDLPLELVERIHESVREGYRKLWRDVHGMPAE